MTGFRVSPAGLVRRSEPVDADLMTFGKVMGGGLPGGGVRRSGRRDGPARARPARSTRPARCPGTRSPPPPGWPRCGLHRRGLRRTSTRPPRRSAGWSREALAAAGVPHRRPVRRQPVLASSSPTTTVRDYDDARRAGRRGATPAFFHAMLDRGVYLPPSRVRGLVRLGGARRRARSTGSPTPCPRRPAPPRPATGGARDRRDDHDTSCTCCGTARCTTPSRILYGRLPGYHLSELGRQMAERVAEALRGPRRHPPGRPRPLERAQETAAPIAAALGLAGRHRRAADRGGQRLRGQAVRRRRRRRCAHPRHWWLPAQPVHARRGASRTRQIAARMLAAVQAARDAAEGHEAVLRQPPAADLDAAPAAWRAAALARPAQARSARWPR